MARMRNKQRRVRNHFLPVFLLKNYAGRRLRGTQRFEELLKRIPIAPVRGRLQGVVLNPIPRPVEERERNV
jgi:hypothetical protein